MKNKIFFGLFLIFSFFFSASGFSAYVAPTVADKAMVVTAQSLASEVGATILNHGGNAIDAAVAVGYALAVVQPCCGNIGGGGFMLIHLAQGKNIFIDFREKAPAAITVDTDLQGYLSVGVPGTVMGLNTALEKYGTLPLSTVMAPAIALAEHGFKLTSGDLCILNSVPKIFPHHDSSYHEGELLIQKNLAKTLRLISKKGTSAFYQGPIAREIVHASEVNHGVLSSADFAHYTVRITDPIQCDYRGYQVITAPPPGSGVTICEILNIVSAYSLRDSGFNSAQTVHENVEAMRYAFFDRNQLGDPDFVKNPLEQLLSSQHAEEIRAKIKSTNAGNSQDISTSETITEKENTTHYAVIDHEGNAVSVTYTLNGFFGSRVIAGETGIFLNNELDDFTLKAGTPNFFKLVQGKPNLIAPNKRPLSSMSPTIVMKDNKPFLITGAAGGSTIITTVVQNIENVIDWDMDIEAAVNAPRYHMQFLPDQIYMEPFAFSKDTLNQLQAMGYQLHLGSPFLSGATWGQAAAILIDLRTGIFSGSADNRRLGGKVAGVRSVNEQKQMCLPTKS